MPNFISYKKLNEYHLLLFIWKNEWNRCCLIILLDWIGCFVEDRCYDEVKEWKGLME